MRILFRCDASTQIGGGHVMRCLTLANTFAAHGAKITFACSKQTAATVPALVTSGHTICELDPQPSDTQHWPKQSTWDLAVVDHYQIGYEQEKFLRPSARSILVIDDLANRRHECDFLLDQTIGRTAEDYRELVAPETQLLIGPQFALLRPEFANARHGALLRRKNSDHFGKLVISLGMTDVGGITARVVRAALDANLDYDIDIITGSAAKDLPVLRQLANSNSKLSLHVDNGDVCRLFMGADLAIGGGGTTSWERCCLGLPSLIIVLAPNQELIARNLSDKGAALIVSDQHSAIVGQLRNIYENPDLRHNMISAAAAVCDGLGALRVTEQILRELAKK